MLKRLILVSGILTVFLIISMLAGIIAGSVGTDVMSVINALRFPEKYQTLHLIILKIRFPRVLLAVLAGATLSVGGVVFQSILRNPLAEPYILGISGGSAIGAIIGILAGFSRFPGIGLTAFAGSVVTLLIILFLASGDTILGKDRLLLSGVMVNAFCSALIMFLISLSHDSRLQNIMFWLMGDLSSINLNQSLLLVLIVVPCLVIIASLSHVMNLLSLGKEMASAMGVSTNMYTIVLLVVTSLMVSVVVGYCGLLGFVGLVIPHLTRLLLGPDHRVLVPACALGGGAYLVICDILARTLPKQGELPSGVITAMIGAPLFVFLLKKAKS